jgi:hypothetical protein
MTNKYVKKLTDLTIKQLERYIVERTDPKWSVRLRLSTHRMDKLGILFEIPPTLDDIEAYQGKQ